jgi:ribosomal protein S18 acetylase RimI-like enzyme
VAVFVRRLKVLDLPRLEQIEGELQADYPSRPGWMRSFRRLVELTLSQEPEGLLIAEVDDVVAGWAAVRQRGVHPMSGLQYGHIFHLSVARAYRSQGIGDRLLRESEAYLRSRGCESIHLSMPVDDPTTAEMFKRAGYRLSAWELERSFK